MTPLRAVSRPRVVVTGHHGYVGSVLAPWLFAHGYDVLGLDVNYFRDCTIAAGSDGVPSLTKDVRDTVAADLEGAVAVVHLAALSGEGLAGANSAWTWDINLHGTVRLAEQARAAGVQRFIFLSSCTVYGGGLSGMVDEASPARPQSEYARSKLNAECALSALASDTFCPTVLRIGTIYGLSPRMRFDTVLNDLIGSAITEQVIRVRSDSASWRAVVHLGDLARAIVAVLGAPRALVHNEVFNTGSSASNVEIGDFAGTLADIVPGCRVEAIGGAAVDWRAYRASFAKFARVFPSVRFRTPAQGAGDVCAALDAVPLTRSLYRDPRFNRLKWLHTLIAVGDVAAGLRRPSPLGVD